MLKFTEIILSVFLPIGADRIGIFSARLEICNFVRCCIRPKSGQLFVLLSTRVVAIQNIAGGTVDL